MARKKQQRRGNNEGSIYQRKDGRWEARVSAGYNNEGKPMRKCFYGNTREEAAQKMNQGLNSVYTGNFFEPAKVTVEDWLNAWLTGRKPYLAESSYLKHETMARQHIIPRLGKVKLKDLTTRQVQNLLNEKLKNGRVDKKGGLSPESARQIHRTLNAALNQAVKERKISHNPAVHCELPKLEPREMRVLNAEELAKFLQAAEDSPYFAAFYLDLATGLRRGELLGLRWKDVDLKRGTVSVWQQLVKSKGTPRLQLKALTKTPKSKRTIVIDPDTVEVIKTHLEKQTEMKVTLVANGIDYIDHGLVFCKEDGKPIDPDNFRRRFLYVLKKTGIPHARLHDIRHTFATMALEEGVNIRAVQEMLGHATIKMTGDVYSHVTDRMKDEAAKKVGGILSNCRQTVVKTDDEKK